MMLSKFIVLISSLLLFSTPLALSAEERGIKLQVERLALVIGNSTYQSAPLKNPINDADDMATALKKMGFKVILKKDADQRTMEDTIRYFGRQLRNGGVGLFYFAGHGMQVDGRNYLIPVDTQIESEADVKYEAVDAGLVLGKMEDARNSLNIVILDACRNNPFSTNFRTPNRGLARMDAPKGSLVAYATAPGEVAADGPERNGIFTKHLIKHMTTPNLPIELVLKRVRVDVVNETSGRQIPWESSSLIGNFYFNSKKTTTIKETMDKPNKVPEGPSEAQVATISDDNVRNLEPWTGLWDVEGPAIIRGVWKIKQDGKIVRTSKDSPYKFEGKVRENQLIGKVVSDYGWIYKIVVELSEDEQSFKGSASVLKGMSGRDGLIRAKRKQTK